MTNASISPEGLVWNAFFEAHKTIIDRFQRIYAEADAIGLVEHEVLARLERAPEGKLRVQDLADLILVSKSGASRIIDRLEEQQLAVREKSLVDRRVVYTMLTPKGRDVLTYARSVWRRAYQQCFTNVLSPDEIDDFRDLMRKICSGNNIEPAKGVLAASGAS